jgi:hypothetical protein
MVRAGRVALLALGPAASRAFDCCLGNTAACYAVNWTHLPALRNEAIGFSAEFPYVEL